MLVRKIGEFGLINRIKKLIKTDSSVIEGLGDDCAVLKYDKYNYQLFTCDMLEAQKLLAMSYYKNGDYTEMIIN